MAQMRSVELSPNTAAGLLGFIRLRFDRAFLGIQKPTVLKVLPSK